MELVFYFGSGWSVSSQTKEPTGEVTVLHVLQGERCLGLQASWPLFTGRSVACMRWFSPEAGEWRPWPSLTRSFPSHVGLHVPVACRLEGQLFWRNTDVPVVPPWPLSSRALGMVFPGSSSPQSQGLASLPWSSQALCCTLGSGQRWRGSTERSWRRLSSRWRPSTGR